jgi:hypothetical protein
MIPPDHAELCLQEIRPMQGVYWQASTGLRWHVWCMD